MTADGGRRWAALRLVGAALGALLLVGSGVGCGVEPHREIVRVEQTLRELPGVGSVEGGAEVRAATVRVHLADRAGACAGGDGRAGGRGAAGVGDGPRGGELDPGHPSRPPPGRHPGEFTVATHSVPAGALAAESMAADARIWSELADAHAGAFVKVHQDHAERSEYLREVWVSLAPGTPPAGFSETLRTLASRPFAPAHRESVTLDVPAAREVPGYGYTPGSSYTMWNTRSEPGLRAFEALAAVQPAGPDDAVGLQVEASGDGPGGPRLEVDAELALAEFAGTPAGLVADGIPGSSAEALAAAYVQVLDASGLPYALTVAVADHPPFLQVRR